MFIIENRLERFRITVSDIPPALQDQKAICLLAIAFRFVRTVHK